MNDIKDLKKFLATPRDISNKTNEEKAGVLTLHFIDYLAKPKGIDDKLYEKCVRAFNDNRGKIEWEIEAVLKVLDENGKNNKKGGIK